MNKKKFAILIGSNAYSKDKLTYTHKDVDDVANVLIDFCQFDRENVIRIKYKEGDTVNVIEDVSGALNKFKTHGFQKNTGTLLFYYSGHGKYDESTDASMLDVSEKCKISIQFLVDKIFEDKANHNFVIIDACNSGGELRLRSKGYSKDQRKLLIESESIYFLLGTSENLFAYEGIPNSSNEAYSKIENGFYTHFLCECVKDQSNYIESNMLDLRVIDAYMAYKSTIISKFDQIPVSHSEIRGVVPFAYWNKETTNFAPKVMGVPSISSTNAEAALICGFRAYSLLSDVSNILSEDGSYYYPEFKDVFVVLEIVKASLSVLIEEGAVSIVTSIDQWVDLMREQKFSIEKGDKALLELEKICVQLQAIRFRLAEPECSFFKLGKKIAHWNNSEWSYRIDDLINVDKVEEIGELAKKLMPDNDLSEELRFIQKYKEEKEKGGGVSGLAYDYYYLLKSKL